MTSASVLSSPVSDEKSSKKLGIISQNIVFLDENFEPGQYDVVCGRGRKCSTHVGNARFREIVISYLEKYSNAEKLEKSNILFEIVNKVRQESPRGGFVKKDAVSGRWQAVGDFLAREKTSQAFRDALHDQYKSSNTSKKKRRRAEQAERLHRSFAQRSLALRSTGGKFTADQLGRTLSSSVGPSGSDLGTQFNGIERGQKAATQYIVVDNSQPLYSAPTPATFHVGQLSQGPTMHAWPNCSGMPAQTMVSETKMYPATSEREEILRSQLLCLLQSSTNLQSPGVFDRYC